MTGDFTKNSAMRNSRDSKNGSSLNIIGEDSTAKNRASVRRTGSHAATTNSRIRKKKRRRKRILFRLLRTVMYIVLFIVAFAAAFFALRSIRSSKGDDLVEAQKTSNVSFWHRNTDSSIETVSLNLTDVDLTGVTIVVDPGHGGEDPGCMSGSVCECDINLAVAQKVAAFLKEYGATVVMTRTEDEYLSLTERAAIANEAEADYFVSLHCNSYENDSGISGLECYYYPGIEDGEALAAAIVEYMEENTQIAVRKYEDNDLSVLRNTVMTAVLIEMGYMSNSTELTQLTTESYQTQLAQAITEGIVYAISQE